MVRRIVAVLSVVALVVSLTGCGLIFGGTRQVVNVRSSPSGATVGADPEIGDYTTPAAISLERKTEYTLTFSKTGYRDSILHLRRSIRGGVVVLDILLGLVPVVVDAATGAWYKLAPEDASVVLEKRSADISGPDQIRLAVGVHHGAGGATELRIDGPEGVAVRVR